MNINACPAGEVAPFKQLEYKCDERQLRVVQGQIDQRVADIIRLTREVQLITHCLHTAIASEYDPLRHYFSLRCRHCGAWLE